MRRRRFAEDSGRVSLFPFLAVLICTMGALLVLLVVISKRAQAKARAELKAQLAEKVPATDDFGGERKLSEMLEQIGELERLREKAEQALTDRRAALSHIEDHTRRLNEERASLAQGLARFEQQGGEDADIGKLEAELQRINKQLAAAGRLLAAEREKARGRQKSFSIIPYQGPNETRRRPIYLECRDESIVLQPEGFVFDKSDLEGGIDSDNPLAAAMRAVSESLARSHPTEIEQEGRPYPLLIVRPSSIPAYYAGRRALRAWQHEFGYEIINEDWEVAYPAANPQLAQVVRQAVEVARRRQALQRLAQRSAAADGNALPPATRSFGGGFGRFVRSEKSSSATGRDSTKGGGAGSGAIKSDASPHEAGGQAGGSDLSGSRSGAVDGYSGSAPRPAVQDEAAQNPLRPPETSGPGGTAVLGAARSPTGKSIVESRGKNWALPRAGNGLVAVTRPIRVECYADRLVVVGRGGIAGRQIISVLGPIRPKMEKFVSAVWDQMKSWGIAGRGLYWKPVLNVYVQPGVERRAGELKQLLDGSGLDVELKR